MRWRPAATFAQTRLRPWAGQGRWLVVVPITAASVGFESGLTDQGHAGVLEVVSRVRSPWRFVDARQLMNLGCAEFFSSSTDVGGLGGLRVTATTASARMSMPFSRAVRAVLVINMRVCHGDSGLEEEDGVKREQAGPGAADRTWLFQVNDRQMSFRRAHELRCAELDVGAGTPTWL